MSEQTKVGVLAVMDDAAETLRSESFYIERERLAEARAAVAELVEAVKTDAADRAVASGLGVSEWRAFLPPNTRAALARMAVTP